MVRTADLLRIETADDPSTVIDRQSDGYDARRGPNDLAALLDSVEPHGAGFVADFGIRMLPELMNYAPDRANRCDCKNRVFIKSRYFD